MDLNAYCATCLSRERHVTPLGAVRARHLQRWLGQDMDSGARLVVCWVCQALVDKTLLFCERALRAKNFLASGMRSTLPNQHKLPLTSFGCTTSCGYNYNFIHSSADSECHDPNIKCEYVNQNSQQEISYLDQDNQQGINYLHLYQDNKAFHVDPNNPIWETTLCPVVGLEEEVIDESNEDDLASEPEIFTDEFTIKNEPKGMQDIPQDVLAIEEIVLPKDEEITQNEDMIPEHKDEIAVNKHINFTLVDGCTIVLKDMTRKLGNKPRNFSITPTPNEDPDVTAITTEVKEIKSSSLKNKQSAKLIQTMTDDFANNMVKAPSSGDGRFAKIIMSYISESAMLARRKVEQRAEAYTSSLFKCETCIVGFNNAVSLEEHNQSKHSPDIGPHRCDVCALRLPDAAALANHRRAHCQQYACAECPFASARLADAQRHRAREHDLPRRYHCAQCDQSFPTARQRQYHHAKFHGKPHQCPHCGKSYFCRNVFRQHLTLHTDRPTYACTVCGRECCGRPALAAHARTHGDGDGAYCAPCGTHYKSKYILRQHLKTSLRHVRKEDLRHGCEQCEQRFATRRDVARHADVVHRNSYAHKCGQCDRAFGDPTHLKKHVQKVHEGVVPDKNKLCEVCNKRFVTSSELVRHQLIHTGERPHVCDTCGASFRQSCTLQTHRRLVHLRLRRTPGGWEPRDAQPALIPPP